MGKDAWKGCQAACKTDNPPANGFEYLESLPQQSRVILDTDYLIQEQFQEDLLAPESEGINPLLLIIFALVIVMVLFYLNKRK